jgi:hypothetical protein
MPGGVYYDCHSELIEESRFSCEIPAYRQAGFASLRMTGSVLPAAWPEIPGTDIWAEGVIPARHAFAQQMRAGPLHRLSLELYWEYSTDQPKNQTKSRAFSRKCGTENPY